MKCHHFLTENTFEENIVLHEKETENQHPHYTQEYEKGNENTHHPVTKNTPLHQSKRLDASRRLSFLHHPSNKYVVLKGVCIPLWLSIKSVEDIEVVRSNILPLANWFRNHLDEITQFNSFIGYSLKESSLSNTDITLNTERKSLLLRRLLPRGIIIYFFINTLFNESSYTFSMVLVDNSNRTLQILNHLITRFANELQATKRSKFSA